MTSKERAYWRGQANSLQPLFQVGKGGISDNMIESFSQALESRELIKITVLNNSEEEASWVANDLAEALNAEVVCTIGHKVVLYRKSNKKGIKHIEF